jgi:hypothetical protein
MTKKVFDQPLSVGNKNNTHDLQFLLSVKNNDGWFTQALKN